MTRLFILVTTLGSSLGATGVLASGVFMGEAAAIPAKAVQAVQAVGVMNSDGLKSAADVTLSAVDLTSNAPDLTLTVTDKGLTAADKTLNALATVLNAADQLLSVIVKTLTSTDKSLNAMAKILSISDEGLTAAFKTLTATDKTLNAPKISCDKAHGGVFTANFNIATTHPKPNTWHKYQLPGMEPMRMASRCAGIRPGSAGMDLCRNPHPNVCLSSVSSLALPTPPIIRSTN